MWSKLFTNTYTNKEWIFIKVPLIGYWFMLVTRALIISKGVAMPKGICSFIPCEFFIGDIIKYVVIGICAVIMLLYILEVKMLWTTLLAFLFGLIAFSIEESNGLMRRNSLFSVVFFAQFFAYLLHTLSPATNLLRNRIQFAVQGIAACYMLSGISKLTSSGFLWIADGRHITLQILKSYYYSYIDHDNIVILEKGKNIVAFIEHNQVLVSILLTGALLLEITALVSIISKKTAMFYGLLLLLMHLGIFLVMRISITPIILPMALFMLNPAYVIRTIIFHLAGKDEADLSASENQRIKRHA